jgi:hypothetical protein
VKARPRTCPVFIVDANGFFSIASGVALGVAALFGLLVGFSPVTLATMPAVLGYATREGSSRRRAFRISVAFVGGMASVDVVIGALFAVLGTAAISFFSSRLALWYAVMAAVLVGLALVVLRGVDPAVVGSRGAHPGAVGGRRVPRRCPLRAAGLPGLHAAVVPDRAWSRRSRRSPVRRRAHGRVRRRPGSAAGRGRRIGRRAGRRRARPPLPPRGRTRSGDPAPRRRELLRRRVHRHGADVVEAVVVLGRATANIGVRGAIILALAAIVLWTAPTARSRRPPPRP